MDATLEAVLNEVIHSLGEKVFADFMGRMAGWPWGQASLDALRAQLSPMITTIHEDMQKKLAMLEACGLSNEAVVAALRSQYPQVFGPAPQPPEAPPPRRRPVGEWPMPPDPVLNAISGSCSMPEIAESLHIATPERPALSATLQRLVKEGRLVKVGTRKACKYQLPSGQQATFNLGEQDG